VKLKINEMQERAKHLENTRPVRKGVCRYQWRNHVSGVAF